MFTSSQQVIESFLPMVAWQDVNMLIAFLSLSILVKGMAWDLKPVIHSYLTQRVTWVLLTLPLLQGTTLWPSGPQKQFLMQE